VDGLFDQIHDLVVKTVISVEPLLWNGIEMFLPTAYSQGISSASTDQKSMNCFELLGFDVLIDNNFKPWLLEVNLSPSLNIDSKLDFSTKGSLLSDLFNLVGLRNLDHQQALIAKENQDFNQS
jgi:tubulin polyglutamylase TTLL5